MVEKRELEAAGASDEATAKKPRPDGPAKPGLSLEALEKAKKALQMQKELKEKLKKLPQLQKSGGAAAPGAAAGAPPTVEAAAAAAAAKAAQIAARYGVTVTPSPAAAAALAPAAAPAVAPGPIFKPAPLRLDAQGREIDENGMPVMPAAAPASVASLRVNQSAGIASVAPEPEQPPQAGAEGDAFFDPGIGARGLKKLNRRARATFDFVPEGEFQRQAELFRLKARYGKDAGARAALKPPTLGAPVSGNANLVPLGPANPNLVPLGEGTPMLMEEEEEPAPEVPEVEWWDKNLLATGSYAADVPQDGAGPVALKENKVTHLVEHPVPLEPPAEAPPPPPQPLKLTARELKKLRTQRRQAREKEKQELIRQGLLEPPKPKVRIANLYRVLGEQAVADPTALEMETRKQMAERQAAHDDRNLARMLTPAERRDKKLKKLFDDSGVDVLTCVYRISRLDAPQNRFKVDVNAKENHMTGVALIAPSFSLVVVEGCGKAAKRYAKLMLRRIDWSLPPGKPKGRGAGETGDNDEMEEDAEEAEPAVCELVWQGAVKARAFERFNVEDCSNDEHALAVLSARGVPHYWHTAAAWVPGEAPPIELA